MVSSTVFTHRHTHTNTKSLIYSASSTIGKEKELLLIHIMCDHVVCTCVMRSYANKVSVRCKSDNKACL
jgi:hypothetical protein